MTTSSTQPPATVQTLWIVHFAHSAAVIFYGIILFIVHPGFRHPELAPTVFWSLAAASLLLIFLSTKLPYLLESKQDTAPDSARQFLGRRQRRMVIMDACVEAGAILGVVACFAGYIDIMQAVILLGISFLGLVAAIPRISGWVAKYETLVSRERVAAR